MCDEVIKVIHSEGNKGKDLGENKEKLVIWAAEFLNDQILQKRPLKDIKENIQDINIHSNKTYKNAVWTFLESYTDCELTGKHIKCANKTNLKVSACS